MCERAKKPCESARLLRQRGMTMMEVMIVLVIIGLVMGISIPSYNSLTHMRLRESATKLSGTIRYLYHQATLKGLCMRLIFDLHENTYKVEASTDGNCLIDSVREDARQAKKREEDEKKKKMEEERRGPAKTQTGSMQASFWGEEQPISLEVKKAVFAAYNGSILKERKLPEGVSFESIYIDHQKESYAKDRGPRYTSFHCFPLGRCQRAVIFLQDSSKEVFSLEVQPLTGRVTVHRGKIKLHAAFLQMNRGDDDVR